MEVKLVLLNLSIYPFKSPCSGYIYQVDEDMYGEIVKEVQS